MTKEENELLTQTAPGTPCGEFMRQYWQPAALSEELPEEGAYNVSDVTVIQGLGPGEQLPALNRGAIDAAVVPRSQFQVPLLAPTTFLRAADESIPCHPPPIPLFL
jgi:hypothetical protein